MIDLRLSDEQEQIVAGAVSVIAHEPAGTDLHARLAEWGWFSIGAALEDEGLGLGLVEELLLHFESGRALLPLSILATSLAMPLVHGAARRTMIAGTTRAALALSLSGDQCLVFDRANVADIVVVSQGNIRLEPAAAFCGEAAHGFDESVLMERGTLPADGALSVVGGRAVLLVAATLSGIARACADITTEYAKVREQFGQPIGSFQAIKHICADMGLRAYAAEAQLKLAAVLGEVDALQVRAAAATALAGAIANAEAAIQVHGGIGFTAECRVHAYLKRAHLLSRLLDGHSAQLRHVLGAQA